MSNQENRQKSRSFHCCIGCRHLSKFLADKIADSLMLCTFIWKCCNFSKLSFDFEQYLTLFRLGFCLKFSPRSLLWPVRDQTCGTHYPMTLKQHPPFHPLRLNSKNIWKVCFFQKFIYKHYFHIFLFYLTAVYKSNVISSINLFVIN